MEGLCKSLKLSIRKFHAGGYDLDERGSENSVSESLSSTRLHVGDEDGLNLTAGYEDSKVQRSRLSRTQKSLTKLSYLYLEGRITGVAKASWLCTAGHMHRGTSMSATCGLLRQ